MARKAESSSLVKVIDLKIQEAEVPIYMVRRFGVSEAALKHFWDYVLRITEKFGGNLPCVLRLIASSRSV